MVMSHSFVMAAFNRFIIPEFFGEDNCGLIYYTVTTINEFYFVGGTTWSKDLIDNLNTG